jgi:hypothetical protein
VELELTKSRSWSKSNRRSHSGSRGASRSWRRKGSRRESLSGSRGMKKSWNESKSKSNGGS